MKGKNFKFAFICVLTYLVVVSSADAVRINLISGGATVDSIDISSNDVINWNIMEIHNASDITWSKVKISLFAISADSSKPIEKMYLYRCKAYGPLDCITKPTIPEPLEFTSYIDTELSWNDMSERVAATAFPQVGNLLLLAKLRGSREAWTGVFIKIERVRYDEFNIYNYDLEELDFYVKEPGLVEPVKKYIENYYMLPMEWSNGVSLKNVDEVYALAADEGSMSNVPINFRPEIPGSEINSIVNDFYFLFPVNSNGVLNPITLNKNPSFTCGDGVCESDLGESSETCCFDCGCQQGYYCDVADIESPQGGVCRSAAEITLGVTGLFDKKITECQDTTRLNFNAVIRNAPSSIQTPISGALEIEDFALPVECHGSANALQCYTEFTTEFVCGKFRRDIEYKLTLPIEYNNGPNVDTKELVFSTIGSPRKLEYECKCESGYFCDVENQICQPEDSITLTVLDSTQVIYEFDPNKNNTVHITAQIENAPANFTLLSTTYKLKEIGIEDRALPGSSGQLSCTLDEEAEEDNVYNCEFTLTIPNYDHEKEYIIRENEIRFKISYEDVGEHKTKKLSAIFSDILIPPYTCGDGICQSLESSETCCLDCGCEGENVYCDIAKGCKSLDDIGLTVKASPTSFEDCLESHVVKIKGQITAATSGSKEGDGLTGYGIAIEPVSTRANPNVPTDVQLDSYEHLEDGVISDYSISCGEINPVTGSFVCELSIGPFDECKQPITIGPNELQIIISFPDGEDIVSKMLTASFSDITITPVVHPGDGVCEEEQGESAATSCIDCPCEDDPQFGPDYYCDYKSGGGGTCKPKSSVRLVIAKPDRDVYFESCDVENQLEIKAYIQNEPSGTYLQYARAILNGEAVDVYCYSDYPFFGGGGLQPVGGGYGGGLTGWAISITGSCSSCGLRPTPSPGTGTGRTGEGVGSGSTGGLSSSYSNMYTCTLTIPPEPDCEEGKSFVYRGVLQFFITYNNGKNVEAGMLSANLPQIFTNKQPPAGYGYEENVSGAAARYAALEEKIRAIEEMKKRVQNCEPNLLDKALIAGKYAAAASADVIVESVCLIPGVDVICAIPFVKDVGKWAIRAGGTALAKSQEKKCDNLKVQLDKIKADYNAELSQTALQDCIMEVVEAYENGECRSSVNITKYASSPSLLERLLGITGSIINKISGIITGMPVAVEGKPDLTVYLNPGRCQADVISLNVKNVGNADSPATVISIDGKKCYPYTCKRLEETKPVEALSPGEVYNIEIILYDVDVSADVESWDIFTATVDPNNVVEELNEENNVIERCSYEYGQFVGNCPTEPWGVIIPDEGGDEGAGDETTQICSGEPCTTSEECSYYDCCSCIDGICQYKCSEDEYCDDGRCVPVSGEGTSCNNDNECTDANKPVCVLGFCRECRDSSQCDEGERCDAYTFTCVKKPTENGTVDCVEMLKQCYERYSNITEKAGTEMYKNEEKLKQGVLDISENLGEAAEALGVDVEINMTELLRAGIEWLGNLFSGDTSDAEEMVDQDFWEQYYPEATERGPELEVA